MKKFTKILLIGCLLVMVSCNNWLDVDPKSQVKDKDLFASDVIVKTCSDSLFSIGQKNCQLFVAKLRNFLDSHNRMVLY